MRAKLWNAVRAGLFAQAMGCTHAAPSSVAPPSSEAGVVDIAQGAPALPSSSSHDGSAPRASAMDVTDAADAATTEPFQRGGSASLPHVDVQMCKRFEGPLGSGHATVRFAVDGSVSRVTLEPPFAGTTEGACIEERFRALRITPLGVETEAGRSFTVN